MYATQTQYSSNVFGHGVADVRQNGYLPLHSITHGTNGDQKEVNQRNRNENRTSRLSAQFQDTISKNSAPVSSTSNFSNSNLVNLWWIIKESDCDEPIKFTENDYFNFSFEEWPSTGFVWNFRELNDEKIRIIKDRKISGSKETVGGLVNRNVLLKIKNLEDQLIILENKCPWAPSEDKKILKFRFQFIGNQE